MEVTVVVTIDRRKNLSVLNDGEVKQVEGAINLKLMKLRLIFPTWRTSRIRLSSIPP